MSAPVTDDLYTSPHFTVDPETAETYDAGYRYTGSNGVIAEVDLWHAIFQNHIVSSYDEDTGYNVDRNVGPVLLSGADVSVGGSPIDNLSVYFTGSYETSHLKDNLFVSNATIATAGKQLVETPEWAFSGRVQYLWQGFRIGVQGKYTGKRYSSDLNDEWTSPYFVADGDCQLRSRHDRLAGRGTSVQRQQHVRQALPGQHLLDQHRVADAVLLSGFAPQLRGHAQDQPLI